MQMKNIVHDDEIIGLEAIIRVAESTYNQCLDYKEVADLEGYIGGEIREDGAIVYALVDINEELSEGINDEVPNRLLKMLEKAIRSGADFLVLTLEKSVEHYAA